VSDVVLVSSSNVNLQLCDVGKLLTNVTSTTDCACPCCLCVIFVKIESFLFVVDECLIQVDIPNMATVITLVSVQLAIFVITTPRLGQVRINELSLIIAVRCILSSPLMWQ